MKYNVQPWKFDFYLKFKNYFHPPNWNHQFLKIKTNHWPTDRNQDNQHERNVSFISWLCGKGSGNWQWNRHRQIGTWTQFSSAKGADKSITWKTGSEEDDDDGDWRKNKKREYIGWFRAISVGLVEYQFQTKTLGFLNTGSNHLQGVENFNHNWQWDLFSLHP